MRGGGEDGGGEEVGGHEEGAGTHMRDGKGKGKDNREDTHGVASTGPGDVVVVVDQHLLVPHGPNGDRAKFLLKKPKEDPWRASETSGATT